MTTQFENFDLSPEMLCAISDMGFKEPSSIQTEAILPVLQKRDIIGQARTGTGKTAAYAIPAIENIDENDSSTQLLILCPTRELVIQVENEIRKLTKYKKEISFTAVYGGQQIEKQLNSIRNKGGAQIVIGTPGRLMDHLRRGSIDLSALKTVVLDEADEMLDMGFREDIAQILNDTPKQRQTVMFSATMENEILQLTKKFQNDPVIINVISEPENMPEIEQVYFEVMSKNKIELLSRLLDFNNVKLGLIFCNTKSMVDDVVEQLKARGYFADGLHGDLNQNQREKVMHKFRKGSTELLVATDVAGRGIDVKGVEAVFNYDLPRDDEDYVHRIGRTGRAGRKGKAFTFISSKQVQHIKRIERANGQRILKADIPTVEMLEEAKVNKVIDSVKNCINSGVVATYKHFVNALAMENYSSLDVASALLKILMDKESGSFNGTVDFDEIEIFDDSKSKRSRRSSSRGFTRQNDSRNQQDRRDRKTSYESGENKKAYSKVDKRIIELSYKSKSAKKKNKLTKV